MKNEDPTGVIFNISFINAFYIYPMNIELSLSTENNKIECGSFFPILFETLLVIEKVRNDFDKQSEP